jgi:PH domain
MQEPFSSLPSAPPPDAAVVYQGIIVPDVRSAASTDGFPSSDQSIGSGMSGSIAGDASVASEVPVLPSPSASSVEQQQQIPAIEPHNPFFENLSIVTSAATAAAAPSLAASVSSEVVPAYGIISPAHSNVNPAAQIIPTVVPAQPPPPRTGGPQPSITASSEAGEDDEDTAPSSTGRAPLMLPTDAISRLIENTKRFLQRKDSEDDEETRQGVLISGYLQKLGRNGKWQTRWFETDGECLSYYKNQKRSKLLATLELQKVGILWARLHTNGLCAKRRFLFIVSQQTTTTPFIFLFIGRSY